MFVLIGTKTGVCAFYDFKKDAEERANHYNNDPFIEPDHPDPDAPYSVREATEDERLRWADAV